MRLAVNFQRLDPTKGGAETYVADLCRRLIAAGHSVDLFAAEWREDALPVGVTPIPVPIHGRTRSARILSFGEESERLLAGREYDCTVGLINTWAHDVLIPQGGVHGASLEYNARRFPEGWRRSLYLAAKRLNPKAGLYAEIERRQYDPARRTRFVAVSRMVRSHLARFHAVPAERVRVIPNAIDSGRLDLPDRLAVRAALRRALNLHPDERVALFVGHNFRLKGLPDLLEAMALRRTRDPAARPIKLLVCGGGRMGPMRRLVARLGLSDDVRLVGFLPRVADAYHTSDFFVLPTYYDPCSLVVFEALACGLPVITTGCNGAGEVLSEGREGFVVPHPTDHDGLATALDRMTEPGAFRAMAANAMALGREQSIDRHVSALVSLFEDVAASKRTATPHTRPERSVADRA